MILQYYQPNYLLALFEDFVAIFFLLLFTHFINNWVSEKHQIPTKVNTKSSIIGLIIVFGISYSIRFPFESLSYYSTEIRVINNPFFHFAIMASIFLPFYLLFVKKFLNNGINDIPRSDLIKPVKKLLIIFGIISWISGAIFTVIEFLDVFEYIEVIEFNIRNVDVFHLGFFWTLSIVIFDMSITLIFNRTLSIERRLPKNALRRSMIIAAIIAFSFWSIQLILFEIFLNRYLGIWMIEQDIRILIGVVSLVYFVCFYMFLKKKYLPKEKIKIEEKLKKSLDSISSEQIQEDSVVLDVKDLTTYFYTEEGIVRAVEGVSFQILDGEVLGLVGETGCGKSVTALSILQLVRPPGKIEGGKVIFQGEDLIKKSENEMLNYRGKDITMIFQDPLNSINPVFKVGDQIGEVYLLHMEKELLKASRKEGKGIYRIAKNWSEDILRELNIAAPEKIIDQYPHELSGGMRQRIQVAMGLACSPKLLIADEPTTALDVTVQNQILKLMKVLKEKFNTSILFITHDLGIISKMCDRVAVMYSGFIVEYGRIQKLFSTPYHPYTKGLITSVPVVGKKRRRLNIIKGKVPNLIYPPSGCRFHPRCDFCFEPCHKEIPKNIEVEPNYYVACHLYDPRFKDLADISIKKVKGEKR